MGVGEVSTCVCLSGYSHPLTSSPPSHQLHGAEAKEGGTSGGVFLGNQPPETQKKERTNGE